MISILYNIIIAPIELVVEVVFELLFRLVGRHETNQGLAVIGVSVVISLLTLPLYRRADAVQQKERDTQQRLSRWVGHIKRHFKGDERFMMLQAYYRENGYSPLYALNGSISLLLEIPFFIAAYHFLSHLEVLNGASFGIISDLGKPDGLLHFGAFSLNILPILMTAINCISAAVYLKGFPLKDKIQTYGMALIFLVLLYNSPAGLVVYWTCNNIFSLVKNIFYKLKNPKKVFAVLCAVLGTGLTLLLVLSNMLNSRKKILFVLVFQYIVLLPLFFYLYKNSGEKKRSFLAFANMNTKDSGGIFIFSCAILALLAGFVVPLNIIASSPVEFVVDNKSPVHFALVSFSQAIGLFIAWPVCIRTLSKENKNIFVLDIIFCCIAFAALLNTFVFPLKAGLVSMFLKYEDERLLSLSAIGIKRLLLNIGGICAVCLFVLFMIRNKFTSFIKILGIVATISLALLGSYNIVSIQKSFNSYQAILSKSNAETDGDSEIEPVFHFSKTGKNVFCIMMDRAAAPYLPYIFDENPYLYDVYEGFTFYPNTVSFSTGTLVGAPPLYGGYEYIPVLQNQNTDKSLLEKREEAVSLLPRIFAKNGYSAVMTNMPWIGETKTSDFYFMDKYPEKITSVYIRGSKYKTSWLARKNDRVQKDNATEILSRNFIRNGIVSLCPYVLRKIMYDKAQYFHSATLRSEIALTNMEGDALSLVNDYAVMDQLPAFCAVDSPTDSFAFMQNPMPHHPAFLQYPDYTIESDVVLDENNPLSQDAHYHVNAATLILLGKWIQWLKQNDVYDNTRIIISADHGAESVKRLGILSECNVFGNGGLNPLLLVKDFNERGAFKSDDSFMTNADVPSLAVKDIIENPVNPATGKNITEISLKAPAVVTTTSWLKTKEVFGDVDTPNRFVINDNGWWTVEKSIFDKTNWKMISPETAVSETENQLTH